MTWMFVLLIKPIILQARSDRSFMHLLLSVTSHQLLGNKIVCCIFKAHTIFLCKICSIRYRVDYAWLTVGSTSKNIMQTMYATKHLASTLLIRQLKSNHKIVWFTYCFDMRTAPFMPLVRPPVLAGVDCKPNHTSSLKRNTSHIAIAD